MLIGLGLHDRTGLREALGIFAILAVVVGLVIFGQLREPTAGTEAAGSKGHPLAGTAWRLVEFQSMSDEVGIIRPADPSRFTLRLAADGTVSMQLDCNRATGTWSADPAPGDSSGGFTFGPLAVTRALCPPPNLDERFARDAEYVRTFLLRDSRLYLSLMADGGIWAWEPLE